MPPKKKRGGATTRGRRGRPPKKASTVQQSQQLDMETASPLASPALDLIDTSSSNSPISNHLEEETKVKVETKIHKKFGIKYHVPDEVAVPPSPIIEDISSSTTTTTTTTTELEETHMDVDSAVENQVENEISEQLHHLDVGEIDEEIVEHLDNQEVQEVDLVSAIVVECVSDVIGNDEEVILETIDSEIVPLNEDSTEEVYYVLEESNEAITLNEEVPPEVKSEEPIAEVPNEIHNDKMEELDEIKEENIEKKSPEKPSRKSKRISQKDICKVSEPEITVPSIILDESTASPAVVAAAAPAAVEETINELEVEPEVLEKAEEPNATTIKEETMMVEEPAVVDELEELKAAMEESFKEMKQEPKEEPALDEEPSLKDELQDDNNESKHQPKAKRPSTKTKKPKEPKDKSKKSKKQTQTKVRKSKEPQARLDFEEDANVRRSTRIKTISTQKVRSRGKGLVKKDTDTCGDLKMSQSPGGKDDKSVFVAPTSTTDVEHKPVKVKSRWRRSSELEMRDTIKPAATSEVGVSNKDMERKKHEVGEIEKRLKQFAHLKENVYLTERISCKEAKKMVCDCFLTQEEIENGEYGCGDDCLNRLLMIECGNLCTVGDRCTNKRFQKLQSASVEAFCTEKKGLGIRAVVNIPSGDFVLEYVGEVLDPEKFDHRVGEYSKNKNQHYYFMSLRADAVIDATMKGNISRFINHSCEPNAETQKWTVNGELRIGFFSKRTILAGEEITFDYQFQRYGKEAQKCFCEAPTCRGWLGEEPDDDDEDDEDDDDDDDEEDEEEEEQEEQLEGKDVNKESDDMQLKTPATVKKIAKKEKAPKRERKPREPRPKRKPRKDRFEDLGIDDEIESLQSTGLKNQVQTLKLSRLMVRAKEPAQRTKLLKLLKKGEFPCRRLFLDYHGLRLIHGWMTDAKHLAKGDPTMESLQLEILQTLAMLPIPNKTMLQDSKVLPTVEKWSVKEVQEESPADSDSNSPKPDAEAVTTEGKDEIQTVATEEDSASVDKRVDNGKSESLTSLTSSASDRSEDADCELRKSNGMDSAYVKVLPDFNMDNIKDELLLLFDDDFVPLEMPAKPPKPVEPPKPKYDILVEIMALALKLLEEWASLKEVFRIPKKERIEQMKEHEREADKRYKALSVEQETERKRDRYRSFQRPFRIMDSDRLSSKDRISDRSKNDRYQHISKMSKHERRELFARQAEEEERRRKQQDMWGHHYKNYPVMGPDPRISGTYDPNRNMQYVWNTQLAQWQHVPVPDPNLPYQNYPVYGRAGHMEPGMLPPNVVQPNMTPANMGAMPPMPNIPARPGYPQEEFDDPSKVQFMGPIPAAVKLPAKWKCVKDKYGRPYYYHIKLRKPQWEPPELPLGLDDPDEESESSSSSETSSLTSSSSSDDSDSDDDTRLMLEIRNKFNKLEAQKKMAIAKKEEEIIQPLITTANTPEDIPGLSDSFLPTDDMNISDLSGMLIADISIDKPMAEDNDSPTEGQTADEPPVKKRRLGLVQELIISPRTEEDRLQFREDVKMYRQNKEIVRKQKEIVLHHTKKHLKASTSNPEKSPKEKTSKKKISTKVKLREMEANANSEESKKIKETFRACMATVMVSILNPYRKPDCKEGRITTTEEFKHLARKLTHFVMLKELKHCDRIEDLECTESVKVKAKEFVRKYMAKFGELYQRPADDLDNF